MAKVVIKILQGSATYINRVRWASYTSSGLQISYSAENDNWLAVDKVVAKISRLTFLAHPVIVVGV